MSTHPAFPQRLYLMQVATILPNVPFVCYLIQMSDGQNILIDTGLAADFSSPPGMPTPIQGKNVIEQLALIGVQPGDIDMVICTHFDPDHSGYHDAFTNAEFIVQKEHYEAAQTYPRLRVTHAHWGRPNLRYRVVDGDIELMPGIDLIKTNGHVVGHQSVLVRLPETGPVLLAIDASVRQELFTPDRPATPMDEDAEAVKVSVRKLIALAEREKVALVIFGHDGPQWEALKKLPEFYS